LGDTGSALRSWLYALICPALVAALSVCVAWFAIQLQQQSHVLGTKLFFIGLLVLAMVLIGNNAEISVGEMSILCVLFVLGAMFFLMYVLSAKDQFPLQELAEDPAVSKMMHFKAFFSNVFFTSTVIGPIFGLLLGLGVSMLIDQYVACSDSLRPLSIGGELVLSEAQQEKVDPQYTGPYCRGPNDWNAFSRVILHWLLAPSVACVITVSVNSLLSNLPVIYAICVALMTNLVAASIFMASNLDFRLYFTVFIVIVFASLLVGAVLEIHNSIALWRTFPFQEEVEETIIAPKLRPWDEGNYGFPKGGAQFERILQAEKALVASRRWIG